MRSLLTALVSGLAVSGLSYASDPAPADDSLARYQPRPYVQLVHPEWATNAALYQINTRQFTPEGTFNAAREHLPRLKALGVDILWLMPIQPIGELNRKGTLGSPYSISDYYGVNPEFGTLEDLRAFIDAAHALDMHVILDWVANHSAWDNALTQDHPDWYLRNADGEMMPPSGTDWADVVEFDYASAELRQYMTEAMVYWVAEVGFDGFRSDVAGFVPLDFWETARAELDAIRPVFMLAEWRTPDLHAHAFDVTYAWDWNNTLHDIAHGRADAGALRGFYFYDQANAWPLDAWRLTFVANHDQNAWDGTQFDRFGDALEAAIVLSVVGEGVPMVYNGQEAGNTNMLEFFERDPIVWQDHPLRQLFTRLFDLLEVNQALWHGTAGGTMMEVPNSVPSAVLSFVRRKGDDAVLAVVNLSAEPQAVSFDGHRHFGSYTDLFDASQQQMDAETTFELQPWSYRVLVQGTLPDSGQP